MDINIKRFVDIDIQQHVASTISSIRDTAVLMTTEGTAGSKVFSSIDELTKDKTYGGFAKAVAYAKLFFNNGGIKLDIHCAIANADGIVSEIKTLPNSEIVVAYTGDYTVMKEAAEKMTANEGTTGNISAVYGISQKILIARTTAENVKDNTGIDNFAVKVSTIQGAEMTIAAYLTKIQIYGTDTIQDYAFTVESFTDEQKTSIVNDDDLLGKVLDNNMNVDMELAGAIRNLGGNLTNGDDLVNQYTLIVLHQTVTDRLVSLLTQKLKGNSGINAIYTTIAGELNRYVTNGYLSTDKTWTKPTKTISYNGNNYTLIKQKTPLTLGYKIVVLPLNSLSDEDKALRKCPPVYIFLADSYGIRNITINGEVI
jgi:hypothetical protein